MTHRAVRVTLAAFIFLVLLAMIAAAYYFARVKPLIRAGKEQGVYSKVPERPPVGGFGFAAESSPGKTIADLRGKVVVVDV